MTRRFKTGSRQAVLDALAEYGKLRAAVPSHEDMEPVFRAAGRYKIPVSEQADLTGLDRRHIYTRHPAAKPGSPSADS